MVKKIILLAILSSSFAVGASSQRRLMDYKYLNKSCVFSSDSTWFIIDTEEDFDQMSDCYLLLYDFSKHTILGVRGESQSHSVPEVEIKLYRDDSIKVYTVEANVFGGRACTNCRVMRPYFQRAIETEKLRDDYLIEFNVHDVYDTTISEVQDNCAWNGAAR